MTNAEGQTGRFLISREGIKKGCPLCPALSQ
jgi:hypothetical protein